MANFQIYVDPSKAISHEIKVTVANAKNTSVTDLEVRFVIEKPEFDISLSTKRIGHELYEVVIPKLKDLMINGVYKYRIEVIIDHNHFVPVRDDFIVGKDSDRVYIAPRNVANIIDDTKFDINTTGQAPIQPKTESVERGSSLYENSNTGNEVSALLSMISGKKF